MKARNKKPKQQPELTKEKKPKRTILRVPRPMGTTALCKELNTKGLDQETNPSLPNQNKELIKKRIQRLYINAYMNHQLIEYDHITKQHKPITLNQLAYLLNMTNMDVMIELSKEMGRMGIVMERHKGEIARGAILGTLFEASELSALTAHQTAILLASQGGKYAPFISGEVNRAIANQIAALKPKLDLIKVLFDGRSGTLGPTNPAVPQAAQLGTKQGTVLTIEMAHNMLLEGHQSVMTNPALLGPITDADDTLKVLPETNPNMQGGNILSSKSLYQGTEEELKSIATEADHTAKNRAKNGHIEVEDEDEFRA